MSYGYRWPAIVCDSDFNWVPLLKSTIGVVISFKMQGFLLQLLLELLMSHIALLYGPALPPCEPFVLINVVRAARVLAPDCQYDFKLVLVYDVHAPQCFVALNRVLQHLLHVPDSDTDLFELIN